MKHSASPYHEISSKRHKTENAPLDVRGPNGHEDPDDICAIDGLEQTPSGSLDDEVEDDPNDLDDLFDSEEAISWIDTTTWPGDYAEDSLPSSPKFLSSGAGTSAQTSLPKTDTLVCYGMLIGLPVVHNEDSLNRQLSRNIPVAFGNNSAICGLEDGRQLGFLAEPAATVLRALEDDTGVELELLALIRATTKNVQRTHRTAKEQHFDFTLSATIYGSIAQLGDIGDYLQACELYLQDPTQCLRNVEYRNPHRISSLDPTAPMTKDFDLSRPSLEELIESKSDLLADVECHTILPESTHPQGLKINLHRHQLQALTFLLQKESGQISNATSLDIWRCDPCNDGTSAYVNTITGESQPDRPRISRGGILADEMGLGKTLAMISLIVYDKDSSLTAIQSMGWRHIYNYVDATLVVVPVSLLAVWDLQLSQHVEPGALKWARYHGKRRATSRDSFKNFDIILTTYSTIVSEWKRKGLEASPLLSSQWRRLVLDEAHEIRNRKATRHKSICSIDAHSRWAITGTPIHNSLNDFASLLQFLQVYPYNDQTTFNEHIIDLCKAHATDEALERLKRLMKALLLRRSRHKTINVPKRVNLIRRLDFTIGEEARYRSFERPIIEYLDNAIAAYESVEHAYVNAVHKIHSLRMLCDLGTYPIKAKSENDSLLLVPSSKRSQPASPLRLSSPARCTRCTTDDVELKGTLLSPARHERCGACSTPDPAMILDSPSNSKYDIEDDHSFLGTTTPDLELENLTPVMSPHSTKISTLVSDVQILPPGTKAVIFSCWTSMLDLIVDALDAASISAVKYDGRLKNKTRAVVLSRFQTDPGLQVILVSMACGAVGLDMTAASHVFLMEPQWNPALEEQALSRVYRMGQTKEVTTVRYIINATFEEHVMEVQDKKKGLVDLLLSKEQPEEKAGAGQRLQNLRTLLR